MNILFIEELRKRDFFEQGEWKIGEQPVPAQEGAAALRKALSIGRPKAESTKLSLTVRYDAEVYNRFLPVI